MIDWQLAAWQRNPPLDAAEKLETRFPVVTYEVADVG